MMNTNTTPEKELTGYPSIDKPWVKYPDEMIRNRKNGYCDPDYSEKFECDYNENYRLQI